jgi:hypothetical protein
MGEISKVVTAEESGDEPGPLRAARAELDALVAEKRKLRGSSLSDEQYQWLAQQNDEMRIRIARIGIGREKP